MAKENETKADTVYAGKIWRWPIWTFFVLDNVDFSDSFHINKAKRVLCAGVYPVDLLIFQNAVEKSHKAFRRKSALSDADAVCQEKDRTVEKRMVAEEDASYLPLSWLQAENTRTAGKGQDCDHMPEMP